MATLELTNQDTVELLVILNAAQATLDIEIGRLVGTQADDEQAELAALEAHREKIRKWIHRLSQVGYEQ